MATTIKNATLTIRLIEEVTLNGTQRGSVNKHEIRSINEISERIMTVPTTEVTMIAASNVVGAGTFLSSSLKYIRLTNLDDTNFVRLTFVSGTTGTANTADFKLEPKRSMMFTNTFFSGSNANRSFTDFSEFTALKGSADTAAVDVELFVASS